ncbi:hypothetical protein [Streptomyces chartreusis]
MIDEFAPLIELDAAGGDPDEGRRHPRTAGRRVRVHRRLPSDQALRAGSTPWIAEDLGITPKELAGMHRRFEVIPGAQAQVEWGDEGKILAHMGIPKFYSFHMILCTPAIRSAASPPVRVCRLSSTATDARSRTSAGRR